MDRADNKFGRLGPSSRSIKVTKPAKPDINDELKALMQNYKGSTRQMTLEKLVPPSVLQSETKTEKVEAKVPFTVNQNLLNATQERKTVVFQKESAPE